MNTININYDEKEDYKLYILNEKNKYVTHEFITNILKKYNIIYKPTDLSLFQKAMTHESYLKRDFRIDKIVKSIKEKNIQPCPTPLTAIPLQIYSYERLEFLGDSVLHHILADYLYDRYDDKDEGFLTKLRTKIENGDTLSNFARILGLHEYVLIARNIEQIGGRNNNDHIFEDTFEAFLGALYKDSKKNFNLCESFVINIIETHIDFAQMIYKDTNYKDLLLQYHHKMKWIDPEYGQIEVIEKNSKKYFNMYVKGSNTQVAGHGIGTSKKRGEQLAAQNALIKYNQLNNDSEDENEIYE
jgi:dsRNA-specific ribonuclease